MMEPRMDLETRCTRCMAYRYGDVNEEGLWRGNAWYCGPLCAGEPAPKENATITKAQDYLRWQAQGNLISGPEWGKLVREMLIAWALNTTHKR